MMFLKWKKKFWKVAEHIYKDPASSVSIDFIYGQYNLYISANDNVLAKAEKTKFGQIIEINGSPTTTSENYQRCQDMA